MNALGPLQIRIMQHVWATGPCTVRDVHTALNAETGAKKLAYTTMLTVMRNLVEGGILDQNTEEKAYRFRALVDEGTYNLEMMRQIRLKLFRGNVDRMLACLAEDHGIDEAKRIRILELAGG